MIGERPASKRPLSYQEVLDLMPKVELHCHLTGTVRVETFADLAAKHGVDLPAPAAVLYRDVETPPPAAPELYAHVPELPAVTEWRPRSPHSFSVLKLVGWINACVIDAADFERVTYEGLQDAARAHTVHREILFNPTIHRRFGVSFKTMVDGVLEGMRSAEVDFGVTSRLIPSIDRDDTPGVAVELVREVIGYRKPHVVGIGLDGGELAGPPERFVEAFTAAERAGLHRTAHAAEADPSARNVVTCLDLLHCERIDHGYFVVSDAAVTERCRQEAVPFTCIFNTTRPSWRPWRKISFQRMAASGLRVTINSDDPAIFGKDLANQYELAGLELGYGPERMREFALNAVESTWLEEDDKRRLREVVVRQLDELDTRSQPESGGS